MLRAALISLFIFVLGLGAASAGPPGELDYSDESVVPEGKIGEQIQSLIDVVNANDPAEIRRFLVEGCTEAFRTFAPMETHVSVALGFYRRTGGVDFHSVRTYTPERPDRTTVILKDRLFGGWHAIVMHFDEEADYLVAGVRFAAARTPSNVEEPPLAESELVEHVRDLVKRACEADVFSGTLLLAKGDEILLTHACGEASKRFHVPNRLDTKFNLGSMNKMFTAIAIAQLVEKGVLSYDDTIAGYVDESWLPRDITDTITIRHLLTHTSGLGNYWKEAFLKGSRELYRLVEDFKPLVVGDTLAFEPGARFAYSNTGFLLLGVVIEEATGQSYFDYIRENVYGPAGMEDSGSYEMDYPVENLAIGYVAAPDSEWGWENNIYKHVIKGGPAGGGFSTVGDLHAFACALQTDKLVSQATLGEMWSDHSGAGYGYGFVVSDGVAGRVVGHSGGFDGINGELDIFTDAGYTAAVLSNYDWGATPVSQAVTALIGRIPTP
jgi:CubicO group peptidase (beta-lactamase class C family)